MIGIDSIAPSDVTVGNVYEIVNELHKIFNIQRELNFWCKFLNHLKWVAPVKRLSQTVICRT